MPDFKPTPKNMYNLRRRLYRFRMKVSIELKGSIELKVDMLETSVKSDVYQSRFYSKHQPYSLLTSPQNLKNIDPEYDPSDEEWEDEEVDEEHAGERSKCTALDARDIVAMRREIAQEGLRRRSLRPLRPLGDNAATRSSFSGEILAPCNEASVPRYICVHVFV